MQTDMEKMERSNTAGKSRSMDSTRQPAWDGASAVISETKNDKPELRVVTDYDDFFKDYVDALVEQKAKSSQAFKVANIVIDAGPWRSYDVQIKQTSDTLLLDFYSPCRHRGGPDADEEILRAL
jgi:hypothetical protein